MDDKNLKIQLDKLMGAAKSVIALDINDVLRDPNNVVDQIDQLAEIYLQIIDAE